MPVPPDSARLVISAKVAAFGESRLPCGLRQRTPAVPSLIKTCEAGKETENRLSQNIASSMRACQSAEASNTVQEVRRIANLWSSCNDRCQYVELATTFTSLPEPHGGHLQQERTSSKPRPSSNASGEPPYFTQNEDSLRS